MSDEKIRAVLARAAEDRTFFDALMANRESALGAFELSPEEKALLMAPTDEQLTKMIEETRKRSQFQIGKIGKVIGGAVIATVGLGVVASMSITTGISPEVAYERSAHNALRTIATAQETYRNGHGSYGELTDLLRADAIEQWFVDMADGSRYEIELTVDGETFTATARHRTRPDTRRAFQVGPDGQVKPLE